MSDEHLLDAKETAARLRISRKTLYELVKRGQIKPVHKPAYLRRTPALQFRETDVEKLLRGEVSSEEEEPPVFAHVP